MSDYARNLYLWPQLSLLAASGDEEGAQEAVRRMTPEQQASLLRDALTSQALMLRDVKAAGSWCEHSRERWAEILHEVGRDVPDVGRGLRSV